MNPANSAQALAQLQDYQKTAQDPNTLLSGQRQQLGVNAANDTVTGLRGAINNTTKLLQQVAPSVMGRTGNSLVTNAQAGRIIQNEQAPIAQNLSTQGTQYNQAAEDANKLESQAEQAAQGLYQGQQDKLSYAQNLYNTLYKQEQDAADRAFQQQQLEAQQAAARAAAAGFSLPGAGGSTPGATGQVFSNGKTKTDAAKAVQALVSTRNTPLILQTLDAISKAAARGSQYDAAKLELLKSLGYGVMNKNQPLNLPTLGKGTQLLTTQGLAF